MSVLYFGFFLGNQLLPASFSVISLLSTRQHLILLKPYPTFCNEPVEPCVTFGTHHGVDLKENAVNGGVGLPADITFARATLDSYLEGQQGLSFSPAHEDGS